MKIHILGTGCSKSANTFSAAEQAVKEAGGDAVVEKVTDIKQMLEFTPWALPALVIDGEVKSAGRSLSADQIKTYFPITAGDTRGTP